MDDIVLSLAKHLNENDVHWGIGGSYLLKSYGILEEVHDLDIIISDLDIVKAIKIMDQIAIRTESPIKQEYKTKNFFVYSYRGLSIDVMSNFRIAHEKGVYEFLFDDQSIVHSKNIDGIILPFTSLEDWLVAYKLMLGRSSKVQMIEDYLKTKGIENRALLERNLNQELPEDLVSYIEDLLALWSKEKCKEESMKFDEAAEIYDKYRPSYPKEMIDDLIEITGLKPSDSIIEVGAGSGKATELLVERGYGVTCIELGQNLANIGIEKFSDLGNVSYIVGRFEDLEDLPKDNKLIFSAQAFHWIPKPIGYIKASQLISEDGYCALFWNRYYDNGSLENNEFNKICREYGLMPLVDAIELKKMNAIELEAIRRSDSFYNINLIEYPWSEQQTYEAFINFLRTTNKYIGMSVDEKDRLHTKLKEIFLEEAIERHYVCSLFIMKKK